MTGMKNHRQHLQLQILIQLEQVDKRLDPVEDKVAEAASGMTAKP